MAYKGGLWHSRDICLKSVIFLEHAVIGCQDMDGGEGPKKPVGIRSMLGRGTDDPSMAMVAILKAV